MEFSIFSDKKFMEAAFLEAEKAYEKKEIPIGAVIVYENRIIAKAHNLVQTLKDPTAHAEILAITSACANLDSKFLSKATMFVTLEPCTMCFGALVLSRLKKIVIGTSDPKTGVCGGKLDLASSNLYNHKIEIEKGVLEGKCSGILKEFFKNLRIEKLKKNQNCGINLN